MIKYRLFLTLIFSSISNASLLAMHGMGFVGRGSLEYAAAAAAAQPVAHDSQAATQPLSQEESEASLSQLTQEQKDAALVTAIAREHKKTIIALLDQGASFPYAVERTVANHKPEILSDVLDYNKESPIYRYRASSEADFISNPVHLAVEIARQRNDMRTLVVLLGDKRVKIGRYVKDGAASGSQNICALFLLAAQGELTNQEIAQAAGHIDVPGVGPILMHHGKVGKLYEAIPVEQHPMVHNMLLKREGGGAKHLKKAAAFGHAYMVSRLLFTAPEGPFDKEDIAQARQAAHDKERELIVNIFDHADSFDSLNKFFPIKLREEFHQIVVDAQPKMKWYDVLNARSGITPLLDKARRNVQQRKVELDKISRESASAACAPILKGRKRLGGDRGHKDGPVRKEQDTKDE